MNFTPTDSGLILLTLGITWAAALLGLRYWRERRQAMTKRQRGFGVLTKRRRL